MNPRPCCVGFALSKSLAVVLKIMSQSCGQACGVLANKRHLLKQCFPEWIIIHLQRPQSCFCVGLLLGCIRVCVGVVRVLGRGVLTVWVQADTGWQRPGNQHILWGPGLWLLGNIHQFSVDHWERFQACAFM